MLRGFSFALSCFLGFYHLNQVLQVSKRQTNNYIQTYNHSLIRRAVLPFREVSGASRKKKTHGSSAPRRNLRTRCTPRVPRVLFSLVFFDSRDGLPRKLGNSRSLLSNVLNSMSREALRGLDCIKSRLRGCSEMKS